MNRKKNKHTMKKPEITPGPWLLRTALYSAHITNGGLPVADVQACHDQKWRENSRAIAALPDLLEALENLVIACDTAPPVSFLQHISEVNKRARAALTKAGYTFD